MNGKYLLAVTLFVIYGSSQVMLGQSGWFERVSRIKPGESTKQDVERLFESSRFERTNSFRSAEQGTYNTKWGQIFVNYALGNCGDGPDDVNFAKGTVLYFSFTPYKSIRMSKLNINLVDFSEEQEDDSINLYHSHRHGGVLYTSANGKLKHVVLTLTRAETDKALCSRK